MTSLEDFRRICPPKIAIFDLSTDRVVRTVIFPRQVLRPNSLLTNLVIDETAQGTCDSAFVYITDTVSPGTHINTVCWFFMTSFYLFNAVLNRK